MSEQKWSLVRRCREMVDVREEVLKSGCGAGKYWSQEVGQGERWKRC
jgi:hypothetical protein